MVHRVKELLKVTYLKFVRPLTNINLAPMALHVPASHTESEFIAMHLLKTGQIIAVPTDTVYGLACCVTNTDAITKLNFIKARDENKPFAICFGEINDIPPWTIVDHLPQGLLSALLPGPITLILPCAQELSQSLSLDGKVGIRIPNYPFIRNIVNGLNCPIVLTSANISNRASAVKIEDFKPLWDQISGIFDGGMLEGPDGNHGDSTVIELCDPGLYTITRAGVAASEASEILQQYGLIPPEECSSD